jgi:predicted metal-binding protein
MPSVLDEFLLWRRVCRSVAGRHRWCPYGADQTVYLVVDRFGSHGSVYRETEVERTDFETILGDFLSGEFNDPVRVIAFNTLEYWADDVSKQVADEIQTRCDIGGLPVPEHVKDFVESHGGQKPAAQLSTCLMAFQPSCHWDATAGALGMIDP